MTRFLIIGDLHGEKPNIYFKKSEFDAIIVVGDVCRVSGFRRKLIYKFFKLSNEERSLLMNDRNFYKNEIGLKRLNEIDKAALESGRRILKFLDSFGKPIFFVPGNWDQGRGESKIKNRYKSKYHSRLSALEESYLAKTNPQLIRGIKNLKDCQYHLHNFEGIGILGYGESSFPEKKYSEEIKKPTQISRLNKRYSMLLNRVSKPLLKLNKKNPTIFLTHNIPNNTKLDLIINKNSWAHGEHYGSTIARDFIKKHKPLVCVGGHIHEHFGKDKIGRTIVINAGFGKNVNTLLEIKDGKVKKIKFVKKDNRKQFNRKVGWK